MLESNTNNERVKVSAYHLWLGTFSTKVTIRLTVVALELGHILDCTVLLRFLRTFCLHFVAYKRFSSFTILLSRLALAEWVKGRIVTCLPAFRL